MLSAVIASGNRPVFIDCEENGVNMNSNIAVSKINRNTGAIIPTAMYGYPFDLKTYQDLSDKVFVLADLAHNLFKDNMDLIRSNGIHAAIYSLGIGKQTTMLGGGLLCTNDADIYQKVKNYRDEYFIQGKEKLLKTLFNFFAYRLILKNNNIYCNM